MLPGWHRGRTRTCRPVVGLAVACGLVGCNTPDKLPARTPPALRLPGPSNLSPAADPAPRVPSSPVKPGVAATPAGLTQPAADNPRPGQVTPMSPPVTPNVPASFPLSPASPAPVGVPAQPVTVLPLTGLQPEAVPAPVPLPKSDFLAPVVPGG